MVAESRINIGALYQGWSGMGYSVANSWVIHEKLNKEVRETLPVGMWALNQ